MTDPTAARPGGGGEETGALRTMILEALASAAPEADPGSLDPSVAFRDQLDIDSVDFLNFVLALERRLSVPIPEADYPKLSTLNGCIAFLSRRATRESPDPR